MKRNKQDKKFMIQLDTSNRDFLTTVFIFTISFAISLISILLSTIAIVISLSGLNPYTISMAIFFGILIIIISIVFYRKSRQISKNIKSLNKQSQEQLFGLYPEYKNKFH